MLEKKVVILMVTYNGSAYLSEQIGSIIKQSYQNWTLMIRNDLSSDNSAEIIQEQIRDDARINMTEDDQGRLGVNGNFNALLQVAFNSDADYFLLSDQDDVWDENKLEHQLYLMVELERKYPDKPLLIHSDLKVVDQSLQEIDGILGTQYLII